MRSNTPEQSGSEPLRWMEPLAADIVAASYKKIALRESGRVALVQCHRMLWRGLLTNRADCVTFRRELSRLASEHGAPESAVDNVNRLVLAELLNVVAARFSRSPREAGKLSYLVTIVACRLAQIRPIVYQGAHPVPEERVQGGTAHDMQRELALAMRRA